MHGLLIVGHKVSTRNAARVSEGTASSVGVIEASSDAQQFNLKTQGASTVLVARGGREGDGGGRKFVVLAFLRDLLELYGIQIT